MPSKRIPCPPPHASLTSSFLPSPRSAAHSYGDINAEPGYARAVVMIFILVTLVVLPMETERYTQLTAMQSKCVLGLVGIHGEGPGL